MYMFMIVHVHMFAWYNNFHHTTDILAPISPVSIGWIPVGEVYFHGPGDLQDPMASPHPATCSYCQASHQHHVGTALIHLGNHIHGANQIRKGTRTNLILWCRASRKEEVLPELD